jgi:hypothetical protein
LIPGSAMGNFLEGEDSHGDHGLVSLVEFRFKAPPGTSYLYITIHLIGQRNCASWASKPQKLVTLRPQPGGETTKSVREMWRHWGEKTMKLSCRYDCKEFRLFVEMVFGIYTLERPRRKRKVDARIDRTVDML